MTKMPLGLKTTKKMTQMQIKMDFLTERLIQAKLKDSETISWNLNSDLTLEKTKMPLGAKLA
jgi:hypothetical protein